MVASKGGISRVEAGKMTRSQARDMSFALAMAHGGDVDWDTGEIKPPKVVQDHVASAVSAESMRFHI